MRVSNGGVRETILRDDHPQFPRTVLHHLQRPKAEVPLHRVLHVSTPTLVCKHQPKNVDGYLLSNLYSVVSKLDIVHDKVWKFNARNSEQFFGMSLN